MINWVTCHGMGYWRDDYPGGRVEPAYLNPWTGGEEQSSLHSTKESDNWYSSGLNHIDKENQYSIPYCAFSCWVAPFDQAEKNMASGYLMFYERKGSPVFFGNSRTGWWQEAGAKGLNREFIRWLFAKESELVHRPNEMGYAEATSKMVLAYPVYEDREGIYPHNFFGSPYTVPWVYIEDSLHVTPYLVSMDMEEIVVDIYVESATNNNPITDATVVIYQPSTGYMQVKGSIDGWARFTIDRSKVDIYADAYFTAYKYRDLTTDYNDMPHQYLPGQYVHPIDGLPHRPLVQRGIQRDEFPDRLTLVVPGVIMKDRVFNITAGLSHASMVEISIIDISGREVRRVYSDKMEAGWHDVRVETEGLSVGVYFIKLRADEEEVMNKVVIVK